MHQQVVIWLKKISRIAHSPSGRLRLNASQRIFHKMPSIKVFIKRAAHAHRNAFISSHRVELQWMCPYQPNLTQHHRRQHQILLGAILRTNTWHSFDTHKSVIVNVSMMVDARARACVFFYSIKKIHSHAHQKLCFFRAHDYRAKKKNNTFFCSCARHK